MSCEMRKGGGSSTRQTKIRNSWKKDEAEETKQREKTPKTKQKKE